MIDEITQTCSEPQNKPRIPLDRHEWIAAATEILADHGREGVRVEVLAKNFGVTKGSFYWHFKDRQDLFDAVLQTWKEGRLRDIDKQSGAAPGHEREQLLYILDLYSANRNRKGIAIELAVRDWARREPQVAALRLRLRSKPDGLRPLRSENYRFQALDCRIHCCPLRKR